MLINLFEECEFSVRNKYNDNLKKNENLLTDVVINSVFKNNLARLKLKKFVI